MHNSSIREVVDDYEDLGQRLVRLRLLQISNLLALLVENGPESALVPLAEEAVVLQVLRVLLDWVPRESMEHDGENTYRPANTFL